MKRLRTAAGFTLPEVMVAFLIATVVLVPVTALLVQAATLQARNERYVTALMLAQGKIEEARAAPSAVPGKGAFPEPYRDYRFTLEKAALAPGVTSIQVRVTYVVAGREEDVSLTSALRIVQP